MLLFVVGCGSAPVKTVPSQKAVSEGVSGQKTVPSSSTTGENLGSVTSHYCCSFDVILPFTT